MRLSVPEHCSGHCYTISVADRGTGLPDGVWDTEAGTITTSGLGLTVVQSLVQKLNATLDVATQGGTTFILTIPMEELE